MMAEIVCNEEFLVIEFLFPTGMVADGDGDVSGLEATLQARYKYL